MQLSREKKIRKKKKKKLSRERATTNDGSDLHVLRFYDDLQKRFAAGSSPTAYKVN